jgi:hypothetical protein
MLFRKSGPFYGFSLGSFFFFPIKKKIPISGKDQREFFEPESSTGDPEVELVELVKREL